MRGGALLLSLLGLVLCFQPMALSLVETSSEKFQVKTGSLLGTTQLRLAEWQLDFDEDIYYYVAPACAAGLTQPHLTAEAVANDPCWEGCDFTIKGPSCGAAFNQSDARCVEACLAHPDRALACDVYSDWHVIEPGIESPPLFVRFSEPVWIRFNWLLPGYGFLLEVIEQAGIIGFSGSPDLRGYTETDFCFGANHPDAWLYMCPSAQCFKYGTWFLRMSVDPEQYLYDYSGNVTVIVRPIRIEPDVARRTEPPAGAPPTYPVQATPLHTPLQFGVPIEIVYSPVDSDAIRFFQLTTPYCGLITIQFEPSDWQRIRPFTAITISVNEPDNIFPLRVSTDIFFADHSLKSVYLCPQEPLRYRHSSDQPMNTHERHFLTVDYFRPELDWKRYKLGSRPDEPLGDSPMDARFSSYFPFPPVGSFQSGYAANTFEVVCPSSPLGNNALLCRSGSASFGTCAGMFFGYPADPLPLSLLPIPTSIKQLDSFSYSNLNFGVQPVRPRTFSVDLLLEVSDDSAPLLEPLGPSWSYCVESCYLLRGPGPFAMASGEWLTRSVLAPPLTRAECNATQYEAVSARIDASIDAMLLNPTQAVSERLIADLTTLQEPWQGCTALVDSLFVATPTPRTFVQTTSCLDNSLDDPCCNASLSWSECCAPRTLTVNVSLLLPNSSAVEGVCSSPACANAMSLQYAQGQELSASGACETNTLRTKLGRVLNIYRDCLTTYFGEDFVGVPCQVDADCQPGGDAVISHCNIIDGRCVFEQPDDNVARFWGCLAADFPSDVRIAWAELKDWSAPDEAAFLALLSSEYTMPGCVDVAHGLPWSPNNPHLVTNVLFQQCQSCKQRSVDPTRRLPPWCDVREGYCSYIWDIPVTTPPTAGCAPPVCEWDSLNPACNASLAGQMYCAACESVGACTEVPLPGGVTSESDCDGLYVCYLANGTVTATRSAQQCQELFSCSGACPAGACSQQQCLAGGRCVYGEAIMDHIASSSVAGVNRSPDGFCTLPMMPRNIPDCDESHMGSFPSSYGCVVFLDCSPLTSSLLLNCTPNYQTPQRCAEAGGVWHALYERSACASAQLCYEPLSSLQSLSRCGSALLSDKPVEQCSACNGEVVTPARWHPNAWLPGVARPARWQPRRLVSKEAESQRAVDFIALFLDIWFATTASISFQLQNNFQCAFAASKQALGSLVCAAQSSTPQLPLEERCFVAARTFAIGRGVVCPDSPVTIVAYPLMLLAPSTAVLGTAGRCISFELYRTPVSRFAQQPQADFANPFLRADRVAEGVSRNSSSSYATVVNRYGVVVGNAIGDGVTLHFDGHQSGSGLALQSIEVCLVYDPALVVSDRDGAAAPLLFDLGAVQRDGSILPMAVAVTFDEQPGYMCTTLGLEVSSGKRVSFVPIQRRADANELHDDSTGDAVVFYVVGSLFAAVVLLVIVTVGRLLYARLFQPSQPINLLWLLFAAMATLRVVCFFLLAAEQLSDGLLSFFLVDFPTLIYLIANTLILLRFIFMRLGASYPHCRRASLFWLALFVGTLLLVLIFVAVLVAFQTTVVDVQGIYGPVFCSHVVSADSSARTIRIVYESCIFGVGVAVALLTAALAMLLAEEVASRHSARLVLHIGVVSSLGILFDSLAFLLFYIIDQPTAYFAIVLVGTEIVPIIYILVRVSSLQLRASEQNTASTTEKTIPSSCARPRSAGTTTLSLAQPTSTLA